MHINLPIFDRKDTKIDGITLCFVIITWVKCPRAAFIKHEKIHIAQWLRQPFTFHSRYFLQMFRNKRKGMSWYEAYRAIDYEVEAREKSKEIP